MRASEQVSKSESVSGWVSECESEGAADAADGCGGCGGAGARRRAQR